MSEIKKRYDRIAPVYDFFDIIPEKLFYSLWRRQLWKPIPAGKILEIGIGTGKNIRYYPPGIEITGIDISTSMLKRACARVATRRDISIELLAMDITDISFTDDTFDVVIGSFVFTVLPNPSEALQEIKRILKPGGTLLLLEFTRSDSRPVAFIQDAVAYITRAVYKAHVNRDIITVIKEAGFQNITTEDAGDGIVRIIRASTPWWIS